MRGGAWPLLGFGSLMVVMMAFNWIWTDDTIQVGLLRVCGARLIPGRGYCGSALRA